MGTVRYTVINGEVIAEKRDGVRRLYVPDPQGNTIALLDNTQTKTDTFTYWPYGEVKSRTGTTPTPFQNVGTKGYYRDSASKTYVRARYLDAEKTRWMTQDPIGFAGGDVNLYRYVRNAPVSLADPTGMDSCRSRCFRRSLQFCWACMFSCLIGNRYGRRAACQLANAVCGTNIPCVDFPETPISCPPRPKAWEPCDWLNMLLCIYDCQDHGGVRSCVQNPDTGEVECECNDGTINP